MPAGYANIGAAPKSEFNLRLEFRLGLVTDITLIYRALPALLNKNYGQLYTSLRGMCSREEPQAQ